jgi:hypothetical protein
MLLEFIITHSSVTVKTGKCLSSIPANMMLTSYDIRHKFTKKSSYHKILEGCEWQISIWIDIKIFLLDTIKKIWGSHMSSSKHSNRGQYTHYKQDPKHNSNFIDSLPKMQIFLFEHPFPHYFMNCSVKWIALGHCFSQNLFSKHSLEVSICVRKSTVFCDIMPCSQLNLNWYVGGTYHLHLQGRRKSWARYNHESRWQTYHLCPLQHPVAKSYNQKSATAWYILPYEV